MNYLTTKHHQPKHIPINKKQTKNFINKNYEHNIHAADEPTGFSTSKNVPYSYQKTTTKDYMTLLIYPMKSSCIK